MKEDILIKARIVSKEWQIKQCEDIIKDTSESVSEKLSYIGLHSLGDNLIEAHNQLQSLLKEIDNQEALRFGLNQDLLKLNNADGYCYCEKCVANREGDDYEKK